MKTSPASGQLLPLESGLLCTHWFPAGQDSLPDKKGVFGSAQAPGVNPGFPLWICAKGPRLLGGGSCCNARSEELSSGI